MKRGVVLIVAIFILSGLALAQGAKKSNLSGTWVLDKKKGDEPSGRGGRAQPDTDITLVIDHKEPALKIKQIVKSPGGERAQDLVYSTDGKENSNPGGVGGAVIKSKTWWDGGRLVTKSTQTGDSMFGTATIEVTETRSLSQDGKELVVDTVIVTPSGERKRHYVYVKR